MKGFSCICIVLILLVRLAQAQPDSAFALNGNNKALRKLGANALKQNDPASAAFYLEAAVKKRSGDYDARFLLGTAYLELRDYERAQRMFLTAYKANAAKRPEALYYHALMQKSNALYDSAALNFKTFKKIYKGPNKSLKKLATKEIAYCDSVKQIIKALNKVVVSRLDTSINKVNTEASPLALGDDELYYVSFRTEKREYEGDGEEKAKTRRLYRAKRKNGKWIFAGEVDGPFNADNEHLGNACMSPDRKSLYFTRCKPNYKGEMICAIYMSRFDGQNWSEPLKLQKEINHPKYTSTMPAIATDPVKGNDVLFFVSNRKNKGKGKLDIWYAVYDKRRNTFKAPRNAGSKINSPQNEISPYFDNDTRTLYYSSDGWGGLGGYDIFRSKGNGSKWETAQNLGTPYNSGADDLYYTISPNRKEGFFVSNRKGGNALKNKTCCDDIYQFKQTDYVQVKLEGYVHESKNVHDEIADAIVEIYIKDNQSDEKFLVKTVKSDATGKFSVALEPGNEYYTLVKKEGYLGNNQSVSTRSITESKTLHKDLQLIERPVSAMKIPNVNYKTDKWELLPASKRVIDSTVYRMMIDNPEIIVEIQAHTDNRGSDSYNLKLSQRRAEGVVSYLIEKGIAPIRLKAKGFGESSPIAPNEQPNGTDNPEGRALNRRTEFRIIGVLDAELIHSSEIN